MFSFYIVILEKKKLMFSVVSDFFETEMQMNRMNKNEMAEIKINLKPKQKTSKVNR